MKPFILIEQYEKELLKPTTHLVFDTSKENLDDFCNQLFKDGFKDPVITTKVYDTIFDKPKFVFTWDGTPSNDPTLQKND